MFLSLLASKDENLQSIRKPRKLHEVLICLIVMKCILFSCAKTHIMNSSSLKKDASNSAIAFHECVHDQKIKEIIGDSIMIHEPSEENVDKPVMESEGFLMEVKLVFEWK